MKVFGRVQKRAFFFLVFVLPFAAEADVLEDVLDRGKLQVGPLVDLVMDKLAKKP